MPLRQGIHETVEQKRTLPTERHAMAADMPAAGISALIWIPVIAFIVLVFYLPVLAIQVLRKHLGEMTPDTSWEEMLLLPLRYRAVSSLRQAL